MRVPYSWLKELLPDIPEPEKLAKVLTMGGLEVEEVEHWRAEDGGAEDVVLITSVTSNRGDLLSMVGVARQAAALLGIDWAPPRNTIPQIEQPIRGERSASHGPVKVEIAAPDACPRYSALFIEQVRIGPSPDWLRYRLEAAGIRSINNVVDCTNYVVWELGQPLHAFDFDLIHGGHVIVRMAEAGERIVTIDGQERVLGPEDLVIADPDRAIALAGIMGGQNTEVNDNTVRVLLESAHFDPTTIRKTSLRVGLSTEASYRFERGVDPNLTLPALAMVAQLVIETAGGVIAGPAIDVAMREFKPRVVLMRPARCNKVLGTEIDASQMAEYLRRLGMEVEEGAQTESGEPALRVTVPTFRADVEREIDLIEEVAIVHGYDNIPLTLPGRLAGTGRLTRRQRLERMVRELMCRAGFYETLSFSMMDPADLDLLGYPEDAPERNVVKIANPMAADASVMRTTLLPALLRACEYNQRQGVEDVALFEINPVYFATEGVPVEPKHLAAVVMGNPFTAEWNLAISEPDFFWLKGALEQVFQALGVEVQWRRGRHPAFHPGQCAELSLGDKPIGVAGRIAPSVQESLDLRRHVYAAELDLDALVDAAKEHKAYKPLPRFPASLRDVAIIVPDDDEHSAAAMEQVIREAGGELLDDVRLFDVFADPEKIGPGKCSLAFHLAWRAPDRTLTDEEVDQLMERVFAALEAAGAQVRRR